MPRGVNEPPRAGGTDSGNVEGAVLDVEGAARFLCINKRHVYRLVHEKRIRFTKVGNRTRFFPADLLAFLEANVVEPRGYHGTELVKRPRENAQKMHTAAKKRSQRRPKLDRLSAP
jgi:excisionase family DNA binding protein